MDKSWTISKNFPADLTKLRSKPEKSFFEVKPYFWKKVNSCFQILNQRSWISEKESMAVKIPLYVSRGLFWGNLLFPIMKKIHQNLPTSSEKLGFLVTIFRYVWRNCSVSDQTIFKGIFFSRSKSKKFIIGFGFWIKDYQAFSRFFWQVVRHAIYVSRPTFAGRNFSSIKT